MGKYNIERISQHIRIGWDGENNWRPQTFDCSSLLATRPSGTVTLWILPNGESEAFPVALTADGNLRTWTPLDSELTGGGGKLQFHCQDGEDVGKSPVYRYVVEDSLLTGAEHPDDTPSWAVQVVEDVTEAAGHYPYIGENGNWFVWDSAEGEFVDTGVSAGGGSGGSGTVKSVNSIEPDANGNVTLSIPSKTSDLQNDSGFLTQHQSLAAYRTATAQDTIDAAQDTAVAAKYTKPSGGIPKTDLASAVQTSLGKADTALQSSDLSSAIDSALAQAKASGEFDGADGAPGAKGDKGDKGDPGENGSDYVLTEQDKADIAALVDVESGVTPSDFPSIADIAELWNSVSKRPTGAWEDYAWHQCPEAVRNYLANVDYDGVAYTESSIGDYAPDPAVPATNTKPIGQTVDGVTFCNTRPNGNAPYATANQSGVLNPLDQVRWIRSATANMRDLGGWPCDGGTVKYGLLYRSGELNAQDEDLLINQLGITVECDLTADGEAAYPGKMRFIGHTSYAMYSLANTEAWQVNLRGIFDAVRYGDPVVFHCSMGADRTGTLACVLEGLLGVSQSDIDKDYELTSFYALRARNGNYQGGTTDWAHLIAQIEALSGDTFRDKVVGFVLGLGFTAEDINAFRHAMIDGTPEDITEPTRANLFDPNDSDVALRCRINSSGAAVAYADGQLVTGFIPASVGDVFRIETDKSLKTNGHTGMVGYYQSDKAYIHQTSQANAQVWTFSDSDLTGVCTILSSTSGKDISSIGYVRFCIAYTDIGNIKIYKQ